MLSFQYDLYFKLVAHVSGYILGIKDRTRSEGISNK